MKQGFIFFLFCLFFLFAAQHMFAQENSCTDDIKYCDESVNKIIHKHGGKWDGNECLYAFDVENVSCGQGGSDHDAQCPDNITYCDPRYNKTVQKHGGKWDGTECLYAFTVKGDCPQPTTSVEKKNQCPDDISYCDTNYNLTIRKHGGKWDGTQCQYAFDKVGTCGQPASVPNQPIEPTITNFDCAIQSNNGRFALYHCAASALVDSPIQWEWRMNNGSWNRLSSGVTFAPSGNSTNQQIPLQSSSAVFDAHIPTNTDGTMEVRYLASNGIAAADVFQFPIAADVNPSDISASYARNVGYQIDMWDNFVLSNVNDRDFAFKELVKACPNANKDHISVIYNRCVGAGINPALCFAAWRSESRCGSVGAEFGFPDRSDHAFNQTFEGQLDLFIDKYKPNNDNPTLPVVQCRNIPNDINMYFKCHCGPNTDSGYTCDNNKQYVYLIWSNYDDIVPKEKGTYGAYTGMITNPWLCWARTPNANCFSNL